MKMEKYNTVEGAIRSFTIEDKDYIFVRHILKPEEKIERHYHKEANEWIVISNGKFITKVADEEKRIDIQNEVLAIHFPKGQPHSFLAKTKVSYFVFRDCNDQTIYTGG